MGKKIFLIIFRIISIVLLIYAIIMIFNWSSENNDNSDLADHLEEISNITEEDNNSFEYPVLNVDFDKLIEENPNTVGWLKVNNTDVNYAVVQAADNSYYMNHNFYGKKNSAGWVFADYRNHFDDLDTNTVLYGHNRKDSSMFGSLQLTQNEYWYTNPENKYIFFNTKSQKMTWEIFSLYKVKAETYCTTPYFTSVDEQLEFFSTIKDRSIYDFGIDLNENDKIITLYTCANNNKYRVIIHAKLVYSE